VKIGVTGVSVRLGVAVGGGMVSVLVEKGVRLAIGLPVGLDVPVASAAEGCAGKITRA